MKWMLLALLLAAPAAADWVDCQSGGAITNPRTTLNNAGDNVCWQVTATTEETGIVRAKTGHLRVCMTERDGTINNSIADIHMCPLNYDGASCYPLANGQLSTRSCVLVPSSSVKVISGIVFEGTDLVISFTAEFGGSPQSLRRPIVPFLPSLMRVATVE